jgi:hypothetical protein
MLVAFLHPLLVPLADVRGIEAGFFADRLGSGFGPQIGEVVVSFVRRPAVRPRSG